MLGQLAALSTGIFYKRSWQRPGGLAGWPARKHESKATETSKIPLRM